MTKIIIVRNGFVNVDNIVSVYYCTNQISYTTVLGHQQGAYIPTIVSGEKDAMEFIYNKLIEFMANNEKVFNAEKELADYRKKAQN